jgi:Ca2+-transporting ATPase
VQEGRRIFANIRAFLTYALAGGLSEVGVMLAGPVIGLTLPLLPGQILWINLLTHGMTGVAFGGEPAAPSEMTKPPRPPAEAIFTGRSRLLLAVAAVTLTVVALAVGGVVGGSEAHRRTAIFVALGLAQLGVALALRASAPRGLRDRGLELAVLSAAALQLCAVYVPQLQDLLGTVALSLSQLVVIVIAAMVPAVAVRLVSGRTNAGIARDS